MKTEVKTEDMLDYIQSMYTQWMESREHFGPDDRCVKDDLKGLLAMRIMTENLIGEPVNLRKDGQVTVGF